MEAGKGQQYKYVLFNSGLFQDIDPEMIDSEQGTLLDSVQFVVKEKVSQVVQKMAGDTEYTDVGANHVCIGLVYLNGYVVEFWRDTTANETSIFLNGVKAAEHEDIPGDATHFLDIDTNNEIGELYITDGKQVPVVYQVADLFDKIGTTEYFADYTKQKYEINSMVQLNAPAFYGLKDVMAGGGLRKGSYSYCMRYINIEGDVTPWSQGTPFIPVPEDYSEQKIDVVPGHRVYGGEASLTPSRFGIKIRIRVANIQGFNFIELKRTTNKEGNPIDYTPRTQSLILSDVDIHDNPISVIEFIDDRDRQWRTYDEGVLNESSPVKSAKTIRLVDGRIVLGGVEYESRTLEDQDIYLNHTNSKLAFPIKKNLDGGYHRIENQVHHKSHRLGERYGYGIKLIDTQGNSLYTIPLKKGVQDFTNYKFPERRDAIPADEKPFSKNPTSTSTKVGNIDEVYEIFDQGTTEKKPPSSFISVSRRHPYNPLTPTGRDLGAVPTSRMAPVIRDDGKDYNPERDGEGEDYKGHRRPVGSYVNLPAGGAGGFNNRVGGGERGFDPSIVDVPVGNNGRRYQGAQALLNPNVRLTDAGSDIPYRINNFNPSIKATGLSIGGIDTSKLPDYIQGFSVARTKPAGRVVCQGIGVYALRESTGATALKKYLNRLWIHFPELDSAIGDNPSLFDEIRTHPENYDIQLVSPVAFNTEVFSGTQDGYHVDMVSYANLLKPTEAMSLDIATGTDHVAFGQWRNATIPSVLNPSHGDYVDDYTFGIIRADHPNMKEKNGRSSYLEIVLGNNIYNQEQISQGSPNTASAKAFHEPFYVVNIIRKGVNVPNNNVNTYQDIGHYQSLDNLVGLGTGEEDQDVMLAGERLEDIMPDYPLQGSALDDRCIYVEGQKWLATNYRPIGDIDTYRTAIDNNGFFTLNGENYYGLYAVDLEEEYEALKTDDSPAETEFTLINTFTQHDNIPHALFQVKTADMTYMVVWWTDSNLDGFITEDDKLLVIMTSSSSTTLIPTSQIILIAGDTTTPTNHDIVQNAIVAATGYQGLGTGASVKIRYPFEGAGSIMPIAIDTDLNQLDSVISVIAYQEGSYYTEPKITTYRQASRIVFPFSAGGVPIVPPAGAEIRIKYDDRIPLSIFLGDVVIGENTFVPLDCTIPKEAEDEARDTHHFALKAPMPYNYYVRSQLYNNGHSLYTTNYIRQWGVLSLLETTINLPMVYKNFFPYRYYVVRPTTWETLEADVTGEAFLEAQGVHVSYDQDYPDEYLHWERGGIHFPQGSNFDYQKSLYTRTFTKPKAGLQEVLVYPKRFHWGLRRNPAFSGIGAMKTFPPFNIYDIKNVKATAIKILYDIYTDKGSNLYAVTDRGVFLLLVGQKYLHDGQGDQSLLIREGTFISQEIPLNNYIGCPDNRWRGKAEGKVKLQGNQVVPVLIFPTENDIAVLQNNSVAEFGTNYLTTLQPVIEDITANTQLAATLHTKENKLLLQVDNELYTYGFTVNNWLTRVPLDYERLAYNHTTGTWIGAYDGKSYVESAGTQFASIGTQPCLISFVVNPGLGHSFEFTDMFLSASDIPDSITVAVTPEFTDPANIVINEIKTYAPGFFYIRFPRTAASKMLNGKNLYIKLQYNDSVEPYTIKYCKVGFRKIAGG